MKTLFYHLKTCIGMIPVIFFLFGHALHAQTPVAPKGHVYTIRTASQLRWVAETVNDFVSGYDFKGDTIVLANDIDLAGIEWIPIGTSHTNPNPGLDEYRKQIPYRNKEFPFLGSFDGQGHVIKNMSINRSVTHSNYSFGLFGLIRSGVNNFVRNVGFVNASISVTPQMWKENGFPTGARYTSTGILAGNINGNIEVSNCYVENSSITVHDNPFRSNTGGLIGSGAGVRNCYIRNSAIHVTATGSSHDDYFSCLSAYVGGITGWSSGAISNCYSDKTNVTSNRSHTGGISGWTSSSHITNCFVTGNTTVTGTAYVANCGNTNAGQDMFVGGIVGYGSGYMKSCYVTGNVTFNASTPQNTNLNNDPASTNVQIGGLKGCYITGKVSMCYVTGKISSVSDGIRTTYDVGGLVGHAGSRLYAPNIFNCIFTGTLPNAATNVYSGAIAGHFYGNYTEADKGINFNYYTNNAYAAIGKSELESESKSKSTVIAASRLLEAGFYLNDANWSYGQNVNENYWTTGVSDYWELWSYYFKDGQMPQLRRLVSEYEGNTWDGLSYLMAPASVDKKVSVTNPAQLAWLANEVNAMVTYEGKTVELTSDIDLANHYWPGIGNTTSDSRNVFKGVFDGKGHTVRNYRLYEYVPRTLGASRGCGLFGQVDGKAVLKNIRIDHCAINANNAYAIHGTSQRFYAGALAGHTGDSTVVVNNCHATNVTIFGDSIETATYLYMGGLIGMVERGITIDRCSAEVTAKSLLKDGGQFTALGGLVGYVYATNCKCFVLTNSSAKPVLHTTTRSAGGLVGQINLSVTGGMPQFNNCHATDGSIRNEYPGSSTGGLVGYLTAKGNFYRLYSSIHVEGRENTGGLVGYITGGDQLCISESFATGNVTISQGSKGEKTTGSKYAGGFVANNWGAVIRNCYASGDVVSNDTLGNINTIGGFAAYSGAALASLNSYASGKVSAAKSTAKTKNIGAFSGDRLVNVVNSFSDSNVSTEGSGTINFNGLFGPAWSTVYRTFASYIPYEDKKYGIATDQGNFKTPVFFTTAGNWKDTTLVVGAAKTNYSTKDWDTDVWLLLDGRYPLLKFAGIAPQTKVSGIRLSPKELALNVGGSETLTANVLPDDAGDTRISFLSRNADIATVNNHGEITAVAAGEAYIVAVTREGGFKDSCLVTVSVPVTGVTLDHTKLAMDTGTETTLIATVVPDDVTNKNVTWASSVNAVATVDKSGKVSAVAKGVALITVTTEDGGYTATCEVTVTDVMGIETAEKPLAKLYPNPSDGRFTVHFDTPGTYRITIANMAGNVLYHTNVTDLMVNPDISNQPSGTYLLTIDNGKERTVIKIVKQ